MEFSGSQTEKLGTSSYNSIHVEWVMNQVVTALKNPDLTKAHKSDPAEILIVPFYRAQLRTYQLALEDPCGEKIELHEKRPSESDVHAGLDD